MIIDEYFKYYYLETNISKSYTKMLNDKIKILNWFTTPRFLVCKCRSINKNKNYYLYFNLYNYYWVLESEIKNMTDVIDKYNIGSVTKINNMEILKPSHYLNIRSVEKLLDHDNRDSKYNTCNANNDSNNTDDNNSSCNDDGDDDEKKEFSQHLNLDNGSDYTDTYIIKTIIPKYRNKSVIKQPFKKFNWFFVLNNINPSGSYNIRYKSVIKIFENEKNKIDSFKTNYHYFIPDNKIKTIFQNEIITDTENISILSFDIECEHEETMPNANIHRISHIGFEIYNKTEYQKCFCCINSSMIKNSADMINLIKDNNTDYQHYTIESNEEILKGKSKWKFMNERKLLLFTKFMLESDEFDYILSYNGHKFDFPYIYTRMAKNHIEQIQYTNKIISSEELGFETFDTNVKGNVLKKSEANNESGVIYLDLYNYVKTYYSTLDDAKLNTFCKHAFNVKCNLTNNNENKICSIEILEKNKLEFKKVLKTANFCFINEKPYQILDRSNTIDVYSDILEDEFKIIPLDNSPLLKNGIYSISLAKDVINIGDADIYQNYDLEKSISIAKYCLHDSKLLRHLFFYECIYQKISAFSFAYFLPQKQTFWFRSSSNCLGIFLKKLLEENQVILEFKSIPLGDYIGGKVYEPINKYIASDVLCFDFQSLYPNIIILHNLSPETIKLVIRTENFISKEIINIMLKKDYKEPDYNICITENNNQWLFIVISQKRMGIIPKLVKQGLTQRLYYKSEMKKNKDNEILYNLYDNMQYITKIFINSIYGLLASQYFIFPCKYSAQACTTFARDKLIFIHDVIHNSVIKDNIWYPNKIDHILYQKIIEEKYNICDYIEKKYKLNKIDKNLLLRVVYGDTDSVMIDTNIKDVKISGVIGLGLEKILNNKILHNCILLEFENIYCNMILLKKKNIVRIKFLQEIF